MRPEKEREGGCSGKKPSTNLGSPHLREGLVSKPLGGTPVVPVQLEESAVISQTLLGIHDS